MSDDDLARLHLVGNATTQAAVLREAKRRDQRDAQSARDREWWKNVEAEWLDWAHSQYLAADAECCGYLLNRAGIAADINPWSLWSGPASRVARYASDELKRFWDSNQRVTVSQFAWHAARPRQHS